MPNLPSSGTDIAVEVLNGPHVSPAGIQTNVSGDSMGKNSRRKRKLLPAFEQKSNAQTIVLVTPVGTITVMRTLTKRAIPELESLVHRCEQRTAKTRFDNIGNHISQEIILEKFFDVIDSIDVSYKGRTMKLSGAMNLLMGFGWSTVLRENHEWHLHAINDADDRKLLGDPEMKDAIFEKYQEHANQIVEAFFDRFKPNKKGADRALEQARFILKKSGEKK